MFNRIRLSVILVIGLAVLQVLYIISSNTSPNKNEALDSDVGRRCLGNAHQTNGNEHMTQNIQLNIHDNVKMMNSQKYSNIDVEMKSEITKNTDYKTLTDYWESSKNTRPLLQIVNFGRLGNQLFHYAVTYCTALQTHRTPTIGKANDFLFTLFPYLSAKRTDVTYFPKINMDLLDKRYMVGEPGFAKYNTKILSHVKQSDKTWLKGCFQSWRYLVGCQKILRREFTFNSTMLNKVNVQMRQFASDYMSKNNILLYDITFIGIHVRLGDMLEEKLKDVGYTHAPPSYINNAMDYYNRKYHWPLFIAASEDIQWCKDNINSTNNNVYFSNYNKQEFLLDFMMLSSCNHSVITVGSYGWFTAWLANGEVVYYDKFPVPGSKVASAFNFTDRYPVHWIGKS